MSKGIYHTDPGAGLSHAEYVYAMLHELCHGNVFPESPSERDRFFRDDLHAWFFYDGSRWIQIGRTLQKVTVTRAPDESGDLVCDGEADDVQINDALTNYLSADRNWQEMVALRGEFVLADTVKVPSYVSLDLRGATITVPAAADFPLIDVNGTIVNTRDHVSILGGSLLGNSPAANQHGLQMSYVNFSEFYDVYLKDLRIGVKATGSVRDTVFQNVVVRDALSFGWNIWGAVPGDMNEITLHICEAYGGADFGFVFNNIAGSRITKCFSASNTLGFRATNGDGNFFKLCDADSNGTGVGYSFANLNSTSLVDCWGATQQSLVQWENSKKAAILGGHAGSFHRDGIKLKNMENVRIIGVNIDACSQSPHDTYDVISIEDSTRILIRDSFLQDTWETPTTRHAVYSYGASDWVSVLGCDVKGCQLAPLINLTVGANNRIENNPGFNPYGNITNPFDNVNHRYGLPAGGAADPTVPNQDYLCLQLDTILNIIGGTGVSVTLKDPAGNNISVLGATPVHALPVPFGFKVNFGDFSAAPTVIVSGR